MGKPYNRPDGRGNAFPLWWLAPPPCPVGSVSLDSQSPTAPCESSSLATPASGGTTTRAYCRDTYEESVSRCFILLPLAGEVRRSRIGGGERSEPISRMLFMPYETESKSRNADFISIVLRAIHNPRPEGPSNLRTLRPSGRSILRTFFHNPFTQPSGQRPINLHTAGVSKGPFFTQ